MYRLYTLLGLVFFNLSTVLASIHCPAEKTIYCDDNYDDTHLTGKAILMGQHFYLPLRYVDTKVLNSCGVGYIDRRWFGDANGNGLPDPTEPQCVQRINILSIIQPITISWPLDITVSCMADVPNTKPTWVSGPCDVIGVSTRDFLFEFEDDACMKIVREFKLVNWCDHGPNIQKEWTYRQVIKVIDTTKPIISDCTPKVFELDANCSAEVILQNSAFDPSSCSTGKLYWIVEIDLWADGTIDHEFAFNKTGQFLITPKNNNEQVSIRIPELLGPGKHKATWKVRDACGNFQKCITEFTTKDNKPPTPYCIDFVSTTFNRTHMEFMNLEASFFNFKDGSFDNCTKKEKLKYSFSPDVNDTIKRIDCFSTGFNFYEIYVTDQNGNQDFCDVLMLIFDNGTCSATIETGGRVMAIHGNPVASANVELMLGENTLMVSEAGAGGVFDFTEMPLFDQSYVKLSSIDVFDTPYQPTLADYFILRDFVLGRIKLDELTKIAADIQADGVLDARDLKKYTDWLLDRPTDMKSGNHFVSIPSVYFKESSVSRSVEPQHLPLRDFNGNMDFFVAPRGRLVTGNIDQRSKDFFIFEVEKFADKQNIYVTDETTLRGLYFKNVSESEAEELVSSLNAFGYNVQYQTQHGLSNILVETNKHFTKEEIFIVLPEYINLSEIDVQLIEGQSYELLNARFVEKAITTIDQIDKVQLYPNPVEDFIVLEGSPILKVEILSIEGVRIAEYNYDGQQGRVEIQLPASLNGGTYMVRTYGVNDMNVLKFVKVR